MVDSWQDKGGNGERGLGAEEVTIGAVQLMLRFATSINRR